MRNVSDIERMEIREGWKDLIGRRPEIYDQCQSGKTTVTAIIVNREHERGRGRYYLKDYAHHLKRGLGLSLEKLDNGPFCWHRKGMNITDLERLSRHLDYVNELCRSNLGIDLRRT